MKNCSKWKTPDRPHTVGVVIYGTVATVYRLLIMPNYVQPLLVMETL